MSGQIYPAFVLTCVVFTVPGAVAAVVAAVLAWQRKPLSRWLPAGALAPALYILFRAALLAFWKNILMRGTLSGNSIDSAYAPKIVADEFADVAANARVACVLATAIVVCAWIALVIRFARARSSRADLIIALCAFVVPVVLVPATYAYARGPSASTVRAYTDRPTFAEWKRLQEAHQAVSPDSHDQTNKGLTPAVEAEEAAERDGGAATASSK